MASTRSLRGWWNRLRWGVPPVDVRSRRVVALIECHLDQNVRDRGAATHPGCHAELLAMLASAGVGIVVLPCPECHALGPARARPAGVSLREAMGTDVARTRCAELAAACADRLEAARESGCTVLAVIGGDVESPGCAVHPAEAASPGGSAGPLGGRASGFMRALEAELGRRGIAVPFRGLRESDPDAHARDLAWIRERVAS